jgi:excisionase family DNA binding protein
MCDTLTWKAGALPLSYTRLSLCNHWAFHKVLCISFISISSTLSQFCPNYLILLPLDLIETDEDSNIKMSIRQGLTSIRGHSWHVVVNKTMANLDMHNEITRAYHHLRYLFLPENPAFLHVCIGYTKKLGQLVYIYMMMIYSHKKLRVYSHSKCIADKDYREKNIRKIVALKSFLWYNVPRGKLIFLFAKRTLNDSKKPRPTSLKFKQLLNKRNVMHYSYDKLSVSQVAELLDTKDTYIYKLIREGNLKADSTNPIKISRTQVHAYLLQRLPSQFTVKWKHEPQEANSWRT